MPSFIRVYRLLALAVVASIAPLLTPADGALIGVVSSAGVGPTTAVEVVPNPGDNLNNNGTYPDVNNYYLMQFATSLSLGADYKVEHDGSSGSNINDGNNVPGTISAGTVVNAYLFHSDSNLGGANATIFEMTVTFENPIIGLNGGQNATDGETHSTSFGLLDTVGVTRGATGGTFDFSGNDFIVNISADRKTIQARSAVNNNTGDANAFDQLWVVTEIPEPSAFALFGLGGLALILRRRK